MAAYSAAELTVRLKTAARRHGFALAGTTPAVAPRGVTRLHAWLAAGYAGEMDYFAERLPAYADLNLVLAGARSLLVLGMPYRTAEPPPCPAGAGRVSRYAWGADYHTILWRKLDQLCAELRELVPGCACRGVTDSAPLMEREFAQLAGLGWIGKNTLLLNRELGSWFFLAVLLTDLELTYDQPFETDHCGTCRACLDACPTAAFPQPYVLDATKCISYLTIETKAAIAPELRGGLGDWFWGCDICQEVCPWNSQAPLSDDPAWQPLPNHDLVPLIELFHWSHERFQEEFRRTPLWRAKRRGLLRNAAIILGNQPLPEALAALRHGSNDSDPIVAEACAWALRQSTTAGSNSSPSERVSSP